MQPDHSPDLVGAGSLSPAQQLVPFDGQQFGHRLEVRSAALHRL
jgi:hypothetical protein